MPEFRIGGHFLDEYLMYVGNEYARAITMERRACVYRIDDLAEFAIGEKARTYHNARVVRQSKCGLLDHSEVGFVFDGRAVDGSVLNGIETTEIVPLVRVTKCSEDVDAPLVQLGRVLA
jgi:hypothetical protein